MTWINFGILGVGGALISVPIILHFLMQPKPKEMIFPAMRFLKERQYANRSRMRIRHFLLLLVRCLVIGLLAVALAGPSVATGDFANWLTLGGIGLSALVVGIVLLMSFVRAQKNWLLIALLGILFAGHVAFGGWTASRIWNSESAQIIGDDQAPVAALMLVDTSPRMGYRRENLTRLEMAKDFGQWLIRQFPNDSQVCVLATDNDRPFFSVDVGAAERRLEKLEVNFVTSSLPSALSEGLTVLEKASQERKEIYIITDLTKASWAGEESRSLLARLKKNEEISLFVIDVGVENMTNFALDKLALSDFEISQSGRLSIDSTLFRLGGAAQRTVKMTIEKQDRSRPVVRDETVIFPENTFASQVATKDIRENANVPLKFTFGEKLEIGTYHGKVAIQGQDGLAVDDERFFTFRVSQQKEVLVVHPSDVNPNVMPSLLAPKNKVEAGTARYRVQLMNQSAFMEMEDSLEDYDAVFVLDPKPMPDTSWQAMESYVSGGGGLAVFLGFNAANGGLADPSFSTEAATRVLTGKLDRQWFSDEEIPDLYLSPKELSHPIFNLVRKQPTSVLWNRFPVYIHWGLEPVQNEEFPTQTLLQYTNREPAVIERVIGSGRVLVITTPITEYGNVQGRMMWNALLTGRPLPAFMLLTGISMHLTQNDAESLNVRVGQTVSFHNELRESPETYQAFGPRADQAPTTLNSLDDQIRYRFTDAPGHYRFKGVFNNEVVLRGFSANLEPGATNLSRMEPSELDTFLGAERYLIAREKNEIQRQQGATRRGQEFYPLVVVMMLVVLAVEYLMSNRFYKD